MAEGLTWNVYDANTMTQADIYGEVLCKLGETNERIVGLSADLAKSTKIGAFAAKYPDRFFNAGIAEQNMFGMAAGLALSGLTPFVSTMAAFTTMRAAEQVRTDICYQNLDVKIIATHGGISFRTGGHHAPLHRGHRHHALDGEHDGDRPRRRNRVRERGRRLPRATGPRIHTHRPGFRSACSSGRLRLHDRKGRRDHSGATSPLSAAV